MRQSVRLAITFFILSTLPVAFVSYVSIVNAERTIEQELENHLATITEIRAADFGRWMENLERMIESIAQRPLVVDLTEDIVAQADRAAPNDPSIASELVTRHLLPHLRSEGLFEAFAVADAQTGRVLVSTEPEQVGTFRVGEDYFDEGRAGTFVGQVRYSPSLEGLALHVGTPIGRDGEEPTAVLVGRVDLSTVSKIITFAEGIHKSEDVYLVNRFGFFVTEPRFGEGYALQRIALTEGVESALAGESGIERYLDYRGVPVVGAYRWLPESQMALMAEIDQREALAATRHARVLGIGLMAGAIVVFAGLGIVLARTMVRPLRRIAAGAEKIGSGEFGHRIGSTRRDEFGDLSRAFDRMAGNLQEITASRDELNREMAKRREAEERLRETVSALRRSEAMFRRLSESSPVGVCIWKDDRLKYVNPAFEEIFGYDAADLVDRIDPIELIAPGDRKKVREQVLPVVEQQPAPAAFRALRKDGSTIPCEAFSRPIEYGGGPAALVTVVDVRLRVEAERLQKMADDIVRSIPTGLLILEPDGADGFVIVQANAAAADLIAGQGHTLEGCRLESVFPPAMIPGTTAVFRDVLDRGVVRDEEVVVGSDHGIRFATHLRAFSIPGGKVVAAFEDITERKRVEAAVIGWKNRYEAAVEASGHVLYDWDSETGDVTYAGDLEGVLGYAEAEMVGGLARWTELVHPEDRPDFKRAIERLLDTREHAHLRYRVRRKDGEYVHVEDDGSFIFDAAGRPRRMLGFVKDVTEARLAAERTEESERRYRAIVELAPVGIVTVNLKGVVESCNREFARITGYDEEALEGVHFTKLPPAHARDVPKYLRMFAVVLRGRSPDPFEASWTTPDGETRTGEVRVSLLRREGRTWGVQVAVQDVTSQRQATLKLRESEAKYRDLVEEIHEVIYAIDERGIITYLSPSVEGFGGYKPEDLIGKSYKALGLGDDFPTIDQMKRIFEKRSELRPTEYRVTTKDGSTRWVRTEARPIRVGSRFAGIRGVLVDVSEAKASELALRISEQRYRSLFENAALGIYQTTPDGRILAANPALVRMLGYGSFEELAERDLEEDGYEPATPRALFKEEIEKTGHLEGVESVWITRDGDRLFVRENAVAVRDDDGNVLYYEGTVEDITHMRGLETQLQQSQRLESIGTLASGVAHEINNPLSGMISYAELISRRVDDERIRDYADAIMSEGTRVAKIVRDLLSFARQEKESHSPARMFDIVSSALTLIGVMIRNEGIRIDIDVPEDLPKVKCRSQQIQQVFVNLLANARQALNERYPETDEDKRIRIVARPFDDDSGHWVRTIVEDRGCGISADQIDRIFDPFFTTKPRDRGTGLGLSVSYGIVRDHRGRLTVESEVDSFTRFTLDLATDNGWNLTGGKDGESNDG